VRATATPLISRDLRSTLLETARTPRI
jgi:hypothetical protein